MTWPKILPELTSEQERISDDFMHYWHEVLPKRYGVVVRRGVDFEGPDLAAVRHQGIGHRAPRIDVHGEHGLILPAQFASAHLTRDGIAARTRDQTACF